MKKSLDEFIKGSTPMHYHILTVGLNAALVLSLPVAVGFIARQVLLRWFRRGKTRREKMNGTRTARTAGSESTNQVLLQNVGERERNEIFSPFWMRQSRLSSGDFPSPGRRNFLGGLHPGGKEFSFLKSKSPMCESAGWTAII